MSTTSDKAARRELDKIENPHVRALLHDLLGRSGINGNTGRRYLAARMRYHLRDRQVPTPPSGRLTPVEIRFVEQRALELVDSARNQLPPIHQ